VAQRFQTQNDAKQAGGIGEILSQLKPIYMKRGQLMVEEQYTAITGVAEDNRKNWNHHPHAGPHAPNRFGELALDKGIKIAAAKAQANE
jgi:hypothetical protein